MGVQNVRTPSNPWTVSAELAGRRLELQRDLNRDIYYRRVNGVDLVTAVFSLNDVDQTGLLAPEPNDVSLGLAQ
jgi:hypothetical protein